MAEGKVVPFRAPVVRDDAARADALDVTRSWIVEAPAGSGKTGLLMQRFLKLLASGSVDEPEEVLAITFTRKATAELRERVVEQLQASGRLLREGAPAFEATSHALARAVMERDAAAGWGLLAQPQRLHIRTIDAVCADVAAALPLLAGNGAGYKATETPDAMYHLAARRTLLALGGSDTELDAALRLVLLHRDGSLGDCEELLARMLKAREQWMELVPLEARLQDAVLENEVRPKLERSLQQVVCAGLTRAAKVMPAEMLESLAWLASELAGRAPYKKDVSPIVICANSVTAPGARAADLDLWLAMIHLLITNEGKWRSGFARSYLGFEVDKTDVQRLKEIIDPVREDEALRQVLCAVRALPPAHYPEEQWRVTKALFRVLQRSLAELKVIFAERGECDFAEMSLAAKTGLRAQDGPSDLAGAEGSALKHLLVDELQDTSAGQYELIEMLTRSWDGGSQTVFLVGDPKQSIYLFRQARVERFLRAMSEARLGDVPLGVLRLTSNFRSQAELVEDGFNADFERIFPAAGMSAQDQPDALALDVPFVRAAAVRPASGFAEARVWHAAVLGESEADEADVRARRPPQARQNRRRLEAEAIRAVVEQWKARALPADRKLGADGRPLPWRVAVLARAREHLSSVIAEFRRPDASGKTIAYRALEIERLGEQAEVIDALALTRALLHPADRVAWLAVLHAPWCGLGLRDLLAIAGEGEYDARHDVLQVAAPGRRHLLSAAGRGLFDRAWPVLEAAWQMRGRTSVATHVERCWHSLGGAATLNAEQRDNVALYFSTLRAVEEPGGRVDLEMLAERVAKLYAKASLREDAVELLTMHAAKGLEWDVVVLPGLERKPPSARAELLNWMELDLAGDGVAHAVLAPIHGRGDEATALYKWLCKVRGDREAAERKRVFYVAATRAREELHLFGAVRRDKQGELCVEKGSLLEAAWGAGEAEFAPLWNRSSGKLLSILRQGDTTEAEGISIAAGSSSVTEVLGERPNIRRLPLSFVMNARTTQAGLSKLDYAAATSLHSDAIFERPEGSAGVRAFGNVVHRYLERVAAELLGGKDPAALLRELPAWTPRVRASLRSEGLAPAMVEKLVERGVSALTETLSDATGQWILSPHAVAASEAAMGGGTLRVDRSFVAGADAGSEGETHLWIVDFKTSEPSSLGEDVFARQERAKYGAQLAAYAAASGWAGEIVLGLYYPLMQRLVRWTYLPQIRAQA